MKDTGRAKIICFVRISHHPISNFESPIARSNALPSWMAAITGRRVVWVSTRRPFYWHRRQPAFSLIAFHGNIFSIDV
jgi:hypothetical protein